MILVLSIMYVVFSALILPCWVSYWLIDKRLWIEQLPERVITKLITLYVLASVVVALFWTAAVIVTWSNLSW